MTRLLDCMPFSKVPGEIFIRGERIRVRPNQIIVWLHLGQQIVNDSNPTAEPFPAILDTGHTHSFSIQQQQLIKWAGMRPEALAVIGAIRESGRRFLLHAANLWMHANVRGMRDRLANRPPQLIEAKSGIVIYPQGNFPRLPILGLRAIAENELILKVDGKRRHATLRTPIRWWPFS